MKRKIVELLLIIFFIALQNTLGRVIRLGGVMPNFMILLPVVFGYLNGSNEGIFVGFFAGLFYDAFSANILGYSSLVFSSVGYVAGLFFNKYEESNIALPLIFTMVGDFVFETVSYFGIFMLHNDLEYSFYLNKIIVPEMLYSALIMLIIIKPLTLLNPHLKSRDKRRLGDLNEGDI
jgi:rod shape-determining protein MreD